MKPLNDCLKNLQKRKEIDPTAPSWLLLHDTDEYLFPGDQSLSISEAMQTDHGDICCLFVSNLVRLTINTSRGSDHRIFFSSFFFLRMDG